MLRTKAKNKCLLIKRVHNLLSSKSAKSNQNINNLYNSGSIKLVQIIYKQNVLLLIYFIFLPNVSNFIVIKHRDEIDVYAIRKRHDFILLRSN